MAQAQRLAWGLGGPASAAAWTLAPLIRWWQGTPPENEGMVLNLRLLFFFANCLLCFALTHRLQRLGASKAGARWTTLAGFAAVPYLVPGLTPPLWLAGWAVAWAVVPPICRRLPEVKWVGAGVGMALALGMAFSVVHDLRSDPLPPRVVRRGPFAGLRTSEGKVKVLEFLWWHFAGRSETGPRPVVLVLPHQGAAYLTEGLIPAVANLQWGCRRERNERVCLEAAAARAEVILRLGEARTLPETAEELALWKRLVSQSPAALVPGAEGTVFVLETDGGVWAGRGVAANTHRGTIPPPRLR